MVEESFDGKLLPITTKVLFMSGYEDINGRLFPAILSEWIMFVQGAFQVIKMPHLSVSIEALQVTTIKVTGLQSLHKASNLSLRFPSASCQHPRHEFPDAHVFPWPGWRWRCERSWGYKDRWIIWFTVVHIGELINGYKSIGVI